jgi:tRNA threonylcarbamoyladenosine biosynthesis protein TsaE
MLFNAKNLDETGKIAENFLKGLKKESDMAVIVALFGNLGAGKTAFVKKCAEDFGINETVISPTFIIEKIYKLPLRSKSKFKRMVHIDAYRLEDESELRHLGFTELSKDPDNIIFIEWPEKIIKSLPPKRYEIHLEFIDEEKRKIEIKEMQNTKHK